MSGKDRSWSGRQRRELLKSGLGGLALAAVSSSFPALLLAQEAQPAQTKAGQLLNVSYDVARELFTQINPAFASAWKARTGQVIEIRQSHGGSSTQARAVADGLPADVVTLNQVTDINFLQKSGLVAAGWQDRFPNHASPYFSLPVFLVRAGNPKGIRDWDDLARPGVQVLLSNPKTSGNGRYAYLGAYAFGLQKSGGAEAAAQDLVAKVLSNVPIFDSGGRGASVSFVEHEIGDVLITFESEVNSLKREYPAAGLQIIFPSQSVRVDFPVAVVDKVVDRNGTRALATAYLQFLYSEAGQDILARNFNRVRDPNVAHRYQAQFPAVRLVSVEEQFGGWDAVAAKHFAAGAVLDQLLARVAKQ
ncbi:MAG: sulfate ABC transporter substrate-binding protein [Steroidobacteraceae bacterium]